ncbi:pyridoxamine 5'-phosphate oxidase [Sphingobacterium pedocola]|uniref:Pyridoxine/pyridoxamine 5'-phosphate oxidase n=1 Tax=Sphingobacterium pedocola TaxID=2082722 RepID=A0ABR9T4Y5_9SPHI|nr:pyridoxamine 5'-phosphate oxidase [Sphingobacterium pedocola]MBE8720406.1 pyridoxamine 5'-phosphate oxidase [Sphingobacterium pedocola]
MAIEHKDIAAIREDYVKGILSEAEMKADPLKQFKVWFDQALDAKVIEPNAMALSTISADGFPSSRIVLLKDLQHDGLRFFTNYQSQKGKDLVNCNRVSVLFFWAELQRQIRIEGCVNKLSVADSDEYFASRPRGSRIGAWSSPQSSVIPDRGFLEKIVQDFTNDFENSEEIPRPDFWGGYVVKPVKFEFWQGRSSRLHDRIQYTLENKKWVINRLAP